MLAAFATWLTAALAPFLWGVLRGLLAERARIGKDKDKGAADQRSADALADQQAADEAKALSDELANLSDADLDDRASKWMRRDS